jgi:hypothetical protein
VPQLSGSVIWFTQLVPQSKPLHDEVQVPETQLGVDPVHAMPQPPQLFASVISFTQAVPQSVDEPLHVGAQTPAAVQDVEPPTPVGTGHVTPQLPQLLVVVMFTSQPSDAFLSQSA